MSKNPFVAGNWVRGENFFGRHELIDRIIHGNRHYIWVVGTRRLGKTSLLKQIELLTGQGDWAARFISLFWDLQGSRDLEGLKESLIESVEDAEERFSAIDVEIEPLESLDLFGILRTLRRKAKSQGLNLLLLCDEAEELITVESHNPETLPRLRRSLQRGENVYTVLASTRRLAKLETASIPDTSPFLHGFIPPVYLRPLDTETAERLVSRGEFDSATSAEILDKTNNHPYLIQLVCERLFDARDLNKVLEEISLDDMVCHFFSLDFQYLDERQKEMLMHVLQNEALSLMDLEHQFETRTETVIKLLYELTQLGFLRQVDSHYTISNYFFKTWLEREKEKLFSESSLQQALRAPQTSKPRPFATPPAPEVGTQLGQHSLLEKLGAGGMGMVFKARDQRLNRMVALKVLHPHLLSDSEFRERFVLEAQAASAMNHPNIATIYQIGEEDGVHYISMEYVAGASLRTWREKHPHWHEQLHVSLQAAKALSHAHSKNVTHRDVKSDNIMVTTDDTAKVMDFGLAKAPRPADKTLTKTGTTLGTLAYMSPEQASGLPTDHRTDIFSFGVVMYELFAGKLPFEGEYELSILYALLNENPEPLRSVNPDLPLELEAVVMKALRKDREERYQKMEDLVAAIEKTGLHN
ncbi:protein kinase [bacterium]|nr:protein kinase [bacterium]